MKPQPRTCERCHKTGGCIAFVNPHTKKPGYWHLGCFRLVCKEVKS